MPSRLTEAERLARHNAEMKFALANNIPLREAKSRMAQERWEQAQRDRNDRLARCGTVDREQSDIVAPAASDLPFWWQQW